MKKEDVHNICDMHVSPADCSPKKLFSWDNKAKWQCIKHNYQLIASVLDRTQGHTPAQAISIHICAQGWKTTTSAGHLAMRKPVHTI